MRREIVIIFIISTIFSFIASAEDFLFETRVVHPLCIAKLVPSLAESEVDYVDTVDLDQCMASELPVQSMATPNGNEYTINYKNGTFQYVFLGTVDHYNAFSIVSYSPTTGISKNILIANIKEEKIVKNQYPVGIRRLLVLYDLITSGNKCNGSITAEKIQNNQLVIKQQVNPALFLSLATGQEDIRGLEKFDTSEEGCLGIVTQMYNLPNKSFNIEASYINFNDYNMLKDIKIETPQQKCFNKEAHNIVGDLDKNQTQVLAHKIIATCLDQDIN
jgi:hypothetical protein